MKSVAALWPLLLAAALLLSANGLHSTILAVRGIAEGFPREVIGLLLSVYFVGFIAGCRYAPRFIATVGHIRAFTAFASVASAAAIAHAIVVDEILWLILRLATGFSFAALQMIMESWLNDSATNETRGRILSVYRITDFTAVTLAQMSLVLFNPENFVVFAIVSVALSLALVPVALTRVVAPPVPEGAKLDLKNLWHLSPVAFAGALGVGLTASSFWSMGPSFVTTYGYEAGTVGYFIGAIILGGAIAQWPIGWISDRFDRRKVLVGSSIGASVMAFFLPIFAGQGEAFLILAAAGFGMFALPNFGLAVAHANDHAPAGSAVSVNGGLLMLYGVAAVFGPILAPMVMGQFGAPSLFRWVCVIYILLAVFCAYRMTRRPAPVQRDPYVPVPRTSPAVFELDPRADETAGSAERQDPAA